MVTREQLEVLGWSKELINELIDSSQALRPLLPIIDSFDVESIDSPVSCGGNTLQFTSTPVVSDNIFRIPSK